MEKMDGMVTDKAVDGLANGIVITCDGNGRRRHGWRIQIWVPNAKEKSLQFVKNGMAIVIDKLFQLMLERFIAKPLKYRRFSDI